MKKLLALLALICAGQGYAVTHIVNNTNDSGPGSFRNAVENLAVPGDSVIFSNSVMNIFVSSAAVDVYDPITIYASPSQQITLDAQGSDNILNVGSGGVKIIGLIFTNGYSTSNGGAIRMISSPDLFLERCVFTGNQAMVDGGAISNSGNLQLIHCDFINNTAGRGAAVHSPSNPGGGMQAIACMFDNNDCTAGGSAIYNDQGVNTMVDSCTFTGNDCATGGYDGGAMFVFAILRVMNSEFINNTTSAHGGAISTYGDSVIIQNNYFEGNSTSVGNGGAVFSGSTNTILENNGFKNNVAVSYGGAAMLWTENGRVVNNAFLDNSVGNGNGGAICIDLMNGMASSPIEVSHNTFMGNVGANGKSLAFNVTSVATLQGLRYNVFSNGAAGSGGSHFKELGLGSILLEGENVVQGSWSNAQASDVLNVNPMLAVPMITNGKLVIELLCGSPARDLASSSTLTMDALGRPRVGTSDAGAFEFQGTPPVVNAGPDFTVCEGDAPFSLNGLATPSGGAWSGAGVSGHVFDPIVVAPAGGSVVTYTVTNAFGCVASDAVNINVVPMPILQLTVTDASCGMADGQISLDNFSSFTSVLWATTGESNVSYIDSLSAGNYQVQATDGSGCVGYAMANVSNSGISLALAPTMPLCYGDATGAVDMTITGAGPYTILWSTGATTEDVSGLIAGTYDVQVTDAGGCQSNQSVTLTQPADLTWIADTISATCGSTNGSAICNAQGGTTPYTYQWFDQSGSLAGQTGSTLSGIGAGYYNVIITDGNGCVKLWNAVVTETGGPEISANTVVDPGCGSLGSIDIDIIAPSGVNTILWSNGATTEDITGLDPGYYSVQVMDGGGCTGMFGVNLASDVPATAEICLVSVNQSTFTNKVVWEKPSSSSISHFNIYRETSVLGQYMLVDTVQYSSLSTFTDPVANPTTRSWKYRLSIVDTCGNESMMSAQPHKTIHLTKNLALTPGDINLIWDEYIGFSYGQHRIWRYSDIDGWNAIDSVTAAQFSYTDQNVPQGWTVLDYFIEVDADSTCVATRADNYNSSRSNKTEPGISTPPADIREFVKHNPVLYPNPASQSLFVRMEGLEDARWINLLDASGRVVKKVPSSSIMGDLLRIDVSDLVPAHYVMIMDHPQGLRRAQFVVR